MTAPPWPEVEPPILLADVLTAAELVTQPFASDTVLDGQWMPDEIRACFKAMPAEVKRTYVQRAVALASLGRRHPGECLAVLLMQACAPPPRRRPVPATNTTPTGDRS
jgi:hypothetical protein